MLLHSEAHSAVSPLIKIKDSHHVHHAHSLRSVLFVCPQCLLPVLVCVCVCVCVCVPQLSHRAPCCLACRGRQSQCCKLGGSMLVWRISLFNSTSVSSTASSSVCVCVCVCICVRATMCTQLCVLVGVNLYLYLHIELSVWACAEECCRRSWCVWKLNCMRALCVSPTQTHKHTHKELGVLQRWLKTHTISLSHTSPLLSLYLQRYYAHTPTSAYWFIFHTTCFHLIC